MNLRSSSARGRACRVALVCSGWVLASSCGGDDTTRVELALDFPAESAANRTGTVHFWILRGKTEEAPNCNALVVEDSLPYDVAFERPFDDVFDYPPAEGEALAATGVDNGSYLVYVEAVDFLGVAQLAGCATADLDGGTETVTIVLRQPGTNDCSEPTVENGDPCDDRDFCTVNDECRSGDCVRGPDRNCDLVADACNSAACDPGIGCVADPFPDATPCDVGDLCAVGASCVSGVCEGTVNDCSEGLPQCYDATCNELTGLCDQFAVSGVDCTDANPCTSNDTCATPGNCSGTPVNSGSCDDGDPCTVLTTCAAGVCQGGGLLDMDGDGHASANPCGGLDCNDNAPQEDPDNLNEVGLCGDGFDNDCDGCLDTADHPAVEGRDSDCGGTEVGLCANGAGVDDDCDGCPNANDVDCGGTETDTECGNGDDDDCDGNIDEAPCP